MLVVYKMDIDLRKYLQQNYYKLTWNEKIKIAQTIIFALSKIHGENSIHRDLHSGNVLFLHLKVFILAILDFADQLINH